ncbi:hypothetical protein DOFOFD_06895 [Acetobacteraceae bacterium EV16P]|uniref:POTRA domain-containing protein n=1 Tax=Sorlinia euscelidii TaxID=3081148 RepID=A0ABU7U3T3_9PROT
MTCKRLVLMASICIFSSVSEDALARRDASDAEANRAARAHGRSDMVEVITVKGNHRIETGTILSYMVVQPGDRFSADEIDRTLKTLYATGLFSDVTINRAGMSSSSMSLKTRSSIASPLKEIARSRMPISRRKSPCAHALFSHRRPRPRIVRSC